ncbi:hypothetical protein LHA01_26850 [Schleiferilactobacillus harbinensis]|nr:hypothetical protein LHA01_26850 [Schleiferilactobacillus harbinensis]
MGDSDHHAHKSGRKEVLFTDGSGDLYRYRHWLGWHHYGGRIIDAAFTPFDQASGSVPAAAPSAEKVGKK